MFAPVINSIFSIIIPMLLFVMLTKLGYELAIKRFARQKKWGLLIISFVVYFLLIMSIVRYGFDKLEHVGQLKHHASQQMN